MNKWIEKYGVHTQYLCIVQGLSISFNFLQSAKLKPSVHKLPNIEFPVNHSIYLQNLLFSDFALPF